MNNLFDKNSYDEIRVRLDMLTPASQRKWGKMQVAQMLAHVAQAFKVPLSKKKLPRTFLGRLLGWMIRSKLYNDSPWKQNLPTAPDFKITDLREFEAEKKKLVELVDAFHNAGPEGISKYPHPFFEVHS
ncbi:MAG: hypothetical protein JWP81_4465 [Ferruginibacter sp.]|nr:hypothetical protein [Ferruginibacter sp.]